MFLMIGRQVRRRRSWLLPEPSSPSATPYTVSIDQLELNDVVGVANSASPPYDGIVVEGTSQFDESSLTSESKPVPKSIGDKIFSGTINRVNPVLVRITHLSGDSMLGQIIGAVREGQVRRAPIERTADLITGYFVPVFLAGCRRPGRQEGGAGGWEFWSLQFAISVFVVACPCGIALAASAALFVGSGLAAQHGILVKGGGEAFQEASQLDCIVFDKTGTITEGAQPSVTDHKTAHEGNIDEV
ncbi:E1-E2 ATPase-domain-containing protein [Aspergillus lucknowensis]|uniref:E1-E2 ATPase-domain-containing protein n=1 Tax=Aspergillus lucknowensis TaxID=176173 RepID=A0ABR4L684_9EURO